jgi:hypothetical protein
VFVDLETTHDKKRENINYFRERINQRATRDDSHMLNIIQDIAGPDWMFRSFARSSVAIQELFVPGRNFLLVALISGRLTGIRSFFDSTSTETVVPEWGKITDH